MLYADLYYALGGSLLLASGGVCILDNLGSYKRGTKEIVRKGMYYVCNDSFYGSKPRLFL